MEDITMGLFLIWLITGIPTLFSEIYLIREFIKEIREETHG